MFFRPGGTIRRREVLHGQLWLEHPVTVVSDSDDALAVLLEPGSTFTFPPHPSPHPWRSHAIWTGTTVLQVHRPGDAYAAWKFFDRGGLFTHWYINFEAPIVKHVDASGGGCYDTDDHGIDIVIAADGTWQWKDYDDPHLMVAEGRLTSYEVDAVMACAHQVADDLDAGRRWWSVWDDWAPSITGTGQHNMLPANNAELIQVRGVDEHVGPPLGVAGGAVQGMCCRVFVRGAEGVGGQPVPRCTSGLAHRQRRL